MVHAESGVDVYSTCHSLFIQPYFVRKYNYFTLCQFSGQIVNSWVQLYENVWCLTLSHIGFKYSAYPLVWGFFLWVCVCDRYLESIVLPFYVFAVFCFFLPISVNVEKLSNYIAYFLILLFSNMWFCLLNLLIINVLFVIWWIIGTTVVARRDTAASGS